MTSQVTKLIARLEKSDVLARQVRRVAPLFDAALAHPAIDGVLRGKAVGHAIHPILVQLPIGSWFSALLLDFSGDDASHRASDRLVGISALTALPAMLTGAAEWRHADPESQRVGVVHAAANDAATLLLAISWLARKSDKRALGVSLSLAAGGLWGLGGVLGGHISLSRKYASHDGEVPATGADLGAF